jgi:hypothetical protein
LREGLRHLFELFLKGSIGVVKKASGKSATAFYFFIHLYIIRPAYKKIKGGRAQQEMFCIDFVLFTVVMNYYLKISYVLA